VNGNIAPSVVQTADGRLEVFTVGSDEYLYYKRQTSPNNSSGWDNQWTRLNLAVLFRSGNRPTIRRNADGTLEVFWTTLNSLSYAYQYTPNTQFLQGIMSNRLNMGHIGDPIVSRDADGRLEVFLVGNDDSRQLYYARQTSSSPVLDFLHPLGGYWSPNRRPALAQSADGRLEVFMVGLDNQLYHRWQTAPNSSQWSDSWVSLGGPLYGDPIVTRNADGRLELFIVGSDGRVYHKWQTSKNNTGLWDWSNGWASL
jgi:hypothetical protein